MLFRSVPCVCHPVASLRSGQQAVCVILNIFGISHGCTDQGVNPGFHKQLGGCFPEFLPRHDFSDSWLSWDSLYFASSVRKLKIYYAVHFSDYVLGTRRQHRKDQRNTRGLPHPLGITVPPVREEGSPHSRVLSPCGSLLPLLSLQPPWDCLGFGVREQRGEES